MTLIEETLYTCFLDFKRSLVQNSLYTFLAAHCLWFLEKRTHTWHCLHTQTLFHNLTQILHFPIFLWIIESYSPGLSSVWIRGKRSLWILCIQTFRRILLDLDTSRPGYFQTWILSDLDTSRPGHYQTWTLPDLDTSRPGHFQTWTLPDLDTFYYSWLYTIRDL